MVQAALAATFALAGLSKLREPVPVAPLKGLGISQKSLGRATVALSVFELVVAFLLLSPVWQFAALIALVFLTFSGILVVARSGNARAADCGCFGAPLQLDDRLLRSTRHAGFMLAAAGAAFIPYRPTLVDIVAGISVGIAFVFIWPLIAPSSHEHGPGGGAL